MKPSQLKVYVDARLSRGFSLKTITPNEARVGYDLVITLISLFLCTSYFIIFTQWFLDVKIILLPFFLLGINLIFGIYGSKKTSTGITKAIFISTSLIFSCIIGILINIYISFIFLWFITTLIPLIIPRLILSLPYGRHKNLIALINKKKGPILIVGGAGYIGTHVIERFLENGNVVRVLDCLMYGPDPLNDFINHPHFELIQGDATDIGKLTVAMKDVSVVIHLAGLVGDPACAIDSKFTRHTNIISTRIVKEVAQSMGVHRFIFASSCSVYGVTDVQIDEDGPLNPVSLYAQTKIDSENELLGTSKDNFVVSILRFATVFGHSRRPRFDLVANLFTAQGMQDGTFTITGPNQWRPFIHVRDLSYAIHKVAIADASLVQGQIFNVGSESLNLTIGDLGQIVSKIIEGDRSVNVVVTEDASDSRNYSVSFKKIERILGFKPKESLLSGIQEMIHHFKNGKYGDYKNPKYSNFLTTKIKVGEFHSSSSDSIYAPISEFKTNNA